MTNPASAAAAAPGAPVRCTDFETHLARIAEGGPVAITERLGQLEEPRQLQEGHLRLHHPELGQVAPGLALLGTERGARQYTRPNAMQAGSR